MKAKLFLTLFLLLPSLFFSQVNLTNKHAITISGGGMINNTTSVDVGIASVNTEMNVLGIFKYEYNATNNLAMGFSAGLFSASSNVGITGVSNIAIFPVMFEFTYSPEAFAFGSSSRMYFGLGIGVYGATGNRVGIKSGFIPFVSDVSESVFGLRPHAGVDFYITDWFKIGPNFSYHIMGDFSEVIGERKNYSGPAFSIQFGFVL